ncbi:hypothetical protein [Nocardioides sp. LML1-1-1.1]|uniref:hypothetical protein n=1 Tax=Nocardioides sp. LML1-1-1.1 TaxID=3135248 RepID=UPI003418FC09
MSRPRRYVARSAAVLVAAVVALVATAGPTWPWVTIAPAGSPVTFVGTAIKLTDIPAAHTVSCTSFGVAGVVTPAAGTNLAYGASTANLATMTSSGCTNPIAGACTLTGSGVWGFALTGPVSGGLWPARFSNVRVAAVCGSVGCSFTMTGAVDGRFDRTVGSPTYQRFTPVTGSSGLLVAASPAPSAGCALLDVVAGDDVAVGGYLTNTGTAI